MTKGNNSKALKEKSEREKTQRKERLEKRSKDVDGLDDAVAAGNLRKRRDSGVGNASESESSPVKKTRRVTSTRNLDSDNSDSKSGSGSDNSEKSDSDEEAATGATVLRSKEKLRKQSLMKVNSEFL